MIIPAPITVKIRGLDERLWSIFAKDGALTAEEQEYLDYIEESRTDGTADEGGAL